jgi:1-aminocyclopropane-1-carboxylate deaminase/D-cysteine desulfhydrase-like pyridoxal-dependent ACC family enzyme
VFAPPSATLDVLHDKYSFSRLADSLGLAVPETLLLDDLSVKLPVREGVLKRTYSRFGEHVIRLPAGDISRVPASDASPWIWQEWITGRSLSTYSLCVDGTVRAHVAYHTPYTLDGGAGVFFEAADGSASVRIAERLAEATGYTGQLSLDLIEDVSGVLWLIECNPRATMGLALLSQEFMFDECWRQVIRSQQNNADLPLFIATPGRTAQLRLATLLWGGRNRVQGRSLQRWVRDLFSAPDILADTGDLRLLLGQTRVLVSYQRQARALGCSLTAAATRDIEWNGAADALTAQSVRSRPPLLENFPELDERFPWTPLLAGKASPVNPADNLSQLGGGNVWVKRDDLVCAEYGGNKARKFEWILGELRAKGHGELWTVGGLCSNHCLAAAVYGQRAGVAVRNFFVPTPVGTEERDLLRVQLALGASLAMLPPRPDDLMRLLNPTSRRPYIVPPGGSSVSGVLGYVDAGLEFCHQVKRGECPHPDTIYIAAASRGTVLGLAMGLRLGGIDPVPRIIAVETTTAGWQRARVLLPTPFLALQRLRAESPTIRRLLPGTLTELGVETDHRFEDLPLGTTNHTIVEALAAAPEEADVRLDAHYSARAYAALRLDLARAPTGKDVPSSGILTAASTRTLLTASRDRSAASRGCCPCRRALSTAADKVMP